MLWIALQRRRGIMDKGFFFVNYSSSPIEKVEIIVTRVI